MCFETIWIYLKLFETIWNYLKLFETVWNYLKLFWRAISRMTDMKKLARNKNIQKFKAFFSLNGHAGWPIFHIQMWFRNLQVLLLCWLVALLVMPIGDKSHIEILYNFYVRAFQNMFFSIWNVEINKSLNFAHVTRLPSKHICDTEKEYSRSFACNVLHAHHVFIPRYL